MSPKSRQVDTDCLYVSYVQELNTVKKLNLNGLIFRIHRHFLNTLSLLSSIDMSDPVQASDKCVEASRETIIKSEAMEEARGMSHRDANETTKTHRTKLFCPFSYNWMLERARKTKNSRNKTSQTSSWVPILCYIFSIHLTANLVFQYSYDFDLMRLMRLRKMMLERPSELEPSVWEVFRNETSQLELNLIKRMQDNKLTLDIIGAPYYHKSITIEFVYLFVVVIATIGYSLSRRYFCSVSPFMQHAIRDSLNYEAEQKHIKNCIQQEVRRFIESESIFFHIQALPTGNKRPPILQINNYQSAQYQLHELKKLHNKHWYSELSPLERRIISKIDHGGRGKDQRVHFGAFEPIWSRHSDSEGLKKSGLQTVHKGNGERIAKMLACGALMPFNRSLDWFSRRTKSTLIYLTVNTVYLISFFATFIMIAVSENDPNGVTAISDILISVSGLGLMVFSSLGCFLFTTYPIFACLDQIVLLNKLLQLCKRCIRLNSAEFVFYLSHHQQNCSASSSGGIPRNKTRFSPTTTTLRCVNSNNKHYSSSSRSIHIDTKVFGLDSTNSPTTSSHCDKKTWLSKSTLASSAYEKASDGHLGENGSLERMNTNLVFILMHYKIFVAQCTEVMRFLGSTPLLCTSILILLPIIFRMHLPYLNMFRATDIRYFAAGLSTAILGPGNMTLVPMCYFYMRCVDLYRTLFSLMAHVTSIENHPSGKGIYDQHAVLMLSKELRDSEKFLDQFSPRFAGFKGNYTTLVKVHFWWGLVMISILVDSKLTGQGFFDSFFNDPLGVF